MWYNIILVVLCMLSITVLVWLIYKLFVRGDFYDYEE